MRRALGARFRQATSRAQSAPQATASRIAADGGSTIAAQTVWSSPPAPGRIGSPRQFGDRIPLETERGYNTTLPPAAFDVQRQLIFAGHGFVVTPLTTGMRVGGAVELGGLDRPPNFARSEAMLEKAARFLPGLDPDGRARVDGLPPVAAGFAAGDRPVAHVARTSSTPSATAISA